MTEIPLLDIGPYLAATPGALEETAATLRLTHYPPAAYGADEYGIAPHTDSSFFTLLAQNKAPGLQIRIASGA